MELQLAGAAAHCRMARTLVGRPVFACDAAWMLRSEPQPGMRWEPFQHCDDL
jgi:hypothetical protein